MWYQTYNSAYTRVLAALMAFLLLIGLLVSVSTVRAVPSEVPSPGTSFDKASSLGLTYPNARSINGNNDGIKLVGSRIVYYFTFTLETPTNVSFWFYSTHLPKPVRPHGGEVIRLYSSGRSNLGKGVYCPSGLYCSGGLSFANLPAGTYFLTVDMSAYSSMSNSTTGWLAWKADKLDVSRPSGLLALDGSQPNSSMAWYSRGDLYGQMPIETRSHWYKVNMGSGQRGSLKLYGDSGSNLNVYLYSDSSIYRAFASGTLTRYPESFSFTVPSGARFIYVQVENTGRSASEYAVQLYR